jgi:PAS domain S-box-containing protein
MPPPDPRPDAPDATAARASEPNQYRALFEQSADAILIIDGETFVDCNQATVDMLRYRTKEELLRTHPSELSPPTQPDGRDSFEKANAMIALAFEKGSHRFEWDHRRADGEVFPVEVLLTAVPQGDGFILHVVWRDISERKALEHQLQQTLKMEAIGKLAGGVAHDFNNLLVAIIGNAQLLELELTERPELRELAVQVHQAAGRAADLTRQLLAFSRKQVMRPRVIDLNHLLEGTQKLLGRLIGDDVELRTRLEADEIRLKIDPTQLEQVVINLITNARDAMPGGGTITLATEEVELTAQGSRRSPQLAPGRYARLTVTDTGQGMEPEVAKHAFDPFYTTKGLGEGTGLGLSTVYGIVKQNRGDVELDTAPSRGTRITIWLPVTSELPQDLEPPVEQQPAPPRGCETILVAEDEAAVSELVARVLRANGYEVLVAANGREAFELYLENRSRISLLLSDVVMPVCGGPELVTRLRDEGIEPRVLFASGYPASELVRTDVLTDDVDLLRKPFTPQQLLERVRGALSSV